MARIKLPWIEAAADVAVRSLTVLVSILLAMGVVPAAVGLTLYYTPRTEQQQMWDAITFAAVLVYAALGSGMLIYSLIGGRRLVALLGFGALTLMAATLLFLKIWIFG